MMDGPQHRADAFAALDKRREEAGITLSSWAKAAGIEPPNMHPWRRGDYAPSETSLARLVDALDQLTAG